MAAGTPGAPRVRDPDRLRRRSHGPIRVFQPRVAADQEASLDSLSPELHRFRHIEGPGWVLL